MMPILQLAMTGWMGYCLAADFPNEPTWLIITAIGYFAWLICEYVNETA